MRRIYLDKFANTYCLPSEQDFGIAPPERYMKVLEGKENEYVEKWCVSGNPNGNRLDIFFSADTYKDKRLVNIKRECMEESNSCTLLYIAEWVVPSSVFKQICDTYKLDPKD